MRVGFYGGNVLKLTEDMQILKPTYFPSVPRLFNRIYGKIKDKFNESQFEDIKKAISSVNPKEELAKIEVRVGKETYYRYCKRTQASRSSGRSEQDRCYKSYPP